MRRGLNFSKKLKILKKKTVKSGKDGLNASLASQSQAVPVAMFTCANETRKTQQLSSDFAFPVGTVVPEDN